MVVSEAKSDCVQYMDPFSGARKGNLFFALLKIFKRPLFYQSIILTLMVSSFATMSR